MAAGICSECPNRLEGKPAGTKTCSPKCRSKRARRIKRQRAENARDRATLPPGMAEVSQVVTKGVKDAAHDVLKEELRPLVREQMTADVLGGIGDLITMTPRAIELLKGQMESADEVIAQRAVTLLLKYTLGNPSVAPPPTAVQPGGLNVFLGVPRPGDSIATSNEPVEGEAVELRECQDCHEFKPLHEFVAGSERCQKCFDGLGSLLKERFGDAYDG